jgi:hypothetical protein
MPYHTGTSTCLFQETGAAKKKREKIKHEDHSRNASV